VGAGNARKLSGKEGVKFFIARSNLFAEHIQVLANQVKSSHGHLAVESPDVLAILIRGLHHFLPVTDHDRGPLHAPLDDLDQVAKDLILIDLNALRTGRLSLGDGCGNLNIPQHPESGRLRRVARGLAAGLFVSFRGVWA
jgi:hypothetical protein